MSEGQEEPQEERNEKRDEKRDEDERPDETKAIEEDPAYNPDNEMLKDVKGG